MQFKTIRRICVFILSCFLFGFVAMLFAAKETTSVAATTNNAAPLSTEHNDTKESNSAALQNQLINKQIKDANASSLEKEKRDSYTTAMADQTISISLRIFNELKSQGITFTLPQNSSEFPHSSNMDRFVFQSYENGLFIAAFIKPIEYNELVNPNPNEMTDYHSGDKHYYFKQSGGTYFSIDGFGLVYITYNNWEWDEHMNHSNVCRLVFEVKVPYTYDINKHPMLRYPCADYMDNNINQKVVSDTINFITSIMQEQIKSK